ncbi:MAG: hypothetical protein AAFU57_18395 [Bacteroidota bacterium]
MDPIKKYQKHIRLTLDNKNKVQRVAETYGVSENAALNIILKKSKFE